MAIPQADNCGEIWVTHPNSSNATETLLILISINGVSLSLAIFLNASAMIALKQIQDIPGGNKVTLFNLSLADFLSGLLSQVLWIVFMTVQMLGHQICPLAKVVTFCGLTLLTVSFSTLVLASIERYIAIFYPFHHERITNSRVFFYLTLSIWFIALVASTLHLFPVMKPTVNIILAVIDSIGCCIITYSYVRVFHFAYKVRQEIKDQASSVGNRQRGRNNRRERGSVKMIAVVVGLSLLFYFPYGISLYIAMFTSIKIDAKAFQALWTFALANSFIDPICYFMFNKKLRKKMIALWGCTGERGDMTS